MSAHIVPSEIPELFLVMIGVILNMSAAKCVTTRVTKPDIVASTSCNERRSYVCVVDDPAVGRIEDTVLKQNRGLTSVGAVVVIGNHAWDAEHVENVTILGCDFMNFESEAIFLAYLLKSAMSIAPVTIMSDIVACVAVWHLEMLSDMMHGVSSLLFGKFLLFLAQVLLDTVLAHLLGGDFSLALVDQVSDLILSSSQGSEAKKSYMIAHLKFQFYYYKNCDNIS